MPTARRLMIQAEEDCPNDVPQEDYDSLVQYYNLAGKPVGDIHFSRWLKACSCSLWSNVSVAHGRVVEFKVSPTLEADLTTFVFPTGLEKFMIFRFPGPRGSLDSWILPTTLIIFQVSYSAISGNINLLALPPNLEKFDISGSASITGDIETLTLPPKLKNIIFGSTKLTGDISKLVLPNSLESIILAGTSTITGTPDISHLTHIKRLDFTYTARSQASVDAILKAVYDIRMAQSGRPFLGILSHNAAPSGILQASINPSTGNEYIYALKNDPNGEGFAKWQMR